MRIDWQSFESGDMSGDELREIKERLANDEKVRQEYEGFMKFKKTVRLAALKEPVPRHRLEQMLGEVCATRTKRRAPYRLIALATAAALLVMAFAFGPALLQNLRPETTYVTSNEYDAREWAHARTGLNLPVIRLDDMGEMVATHAGKDWACYDYVVDGVKYTLWMKSERKAATGNANWYTRDGVGFYENANTGFNMAGINFEIEGGDAESRRWVAYRVAQECLSCPLLNRQLSL